MTQLLKNEIIDAYLSGCTLKELELRFNKPSSNLIEMLRRAGVYTPKNKRWQKEELDYLKENYTYGEWDDLLINLPRFSRDDIIHKAYKLGIKRAVKRWSDDDVTKLIALHAKGLPPRKIALEFPEYTPCAVHTKMINLNLITSFKWTDDEVEYLKANYSTKPMHVICKHLKRHTKSSIRTLAHSYGLLSKDWLDKQKGKDSYRNLSHFFRSNNLQWKINSMEQCDYKCVVTGDRFDEIHHLVGVDIIINETLVKNNIELKNNFSDYTKEELEQLLRLFLEEQAKYPLGVCLRKDIHRDFHNKFGYGKNTKEQFEQYLKENYNITNPVTTTAS